MDLRLALYGRAAGGEDTDAHTTAADQQQHAALHAEAALSSWLIWGSGLVAEPVHAYQRISEAALRAHGERVPEHPNDQNP
jgi:hypothetical protein